MVTLKELRELMVCEFVQRLPGETVVTASFGRDADNLMLHASGGKSIRCSSRVGTSMTTLRIMTRLPEAELLNRVEFDQLMRIVETRGIETTLHALAAIVSLLNISQQCDFYCEDSREH